MLNHIAARQLREAAGGCTTLLACLEDLRNQIEQRHSSECVKTVQAFESSHKTSKAAEGLLAPSAPNVMMQLRDATPCAAAANKVVLEAEQGKDANKKEVQDLKAELGGKRPQHSMAEK